MRKIDKSILLCSLVCCFELTALGNDYKSLNEYSTNCEKLNTQSYEYLKSLTLPEFQNKIGYSNDLTVIRRKDFEYPRDIRNYDYQQTNKLYKKYCESQGGTLYGNEEGYYHPIGYPWPRTRSYSTEFGDEAICIKDKSAIFVKNFKQVVENCHFFCDYPQSNRTIEHAEILLTNKPEILDTYTNKFKEFLKSNPNYAEELKEARVGHMTCSGETTLDGIGIKLSSEDSKSLKIYNGTSDAIKINSIAVEYDVVQDTVPFKITKKIENMDAIVNQNASLLLDDELNKSINKALRDAFKSALPAIKPMAFHVEIKYSTLNNKVPIVKAFAVNVIPKENDGFRFSKWWSE